MQIGFNLPISGPMASAKVMAEIAQLGESRCLDYIKLTHQKQIPQNHAPGYKK